MESRIPLPTDNIYKFYALFGLTLFIFSFGGALYVGRSTNEVVFQTIPEIESIKQIANPTVADLAKKQVLEKRLEVAVADRTLNVRLLGGLGGIAILLMAFGFWKWHTKVQRVETEMAELQLRKLRHEVSLLTARCPPASEASQTDSAEVED